LRLTKIPIVLAVVEYGTCPQVMIVVSGSVGSAISKEGSEYSHVLAVAGTTKRKTESKNAQTNRAYLLFIISPFQKKRKELMIHL
jgi:hypothetical protein